MPRLAALFATFALAGPLGAQSLYLGEQEFDTGDHAAMAAVIEHCAGLVKDGGDGETAEDAAPGEEADASAPETTGPDAAAGGEVLGAAPVIALELLASGEAPKEPAGDGSDAGTPPELGTESSSEGPDLSQVTAELCAAAGVIH